MSLSFKHFLTENPPLSFSNTSQYAKPIPQALRDTVELANVAKLYPIFADKLTKAWDDDCQGKDKSDTLFDKMLANDAVITKLAGEQVPPNVKKDLAKLLAFHQHAFPNRSKAEEPSKSGSWGDAHIIKRPLR